MGIDGNCFGVCPNVYLLQFTSYVVSFTKHVSSANSLGIEFILDVVYVCFSVTLTLYGLVLIFLNSIPAST